MLPAALVMFCRLSLGPIAWFGPATATFNVMFAGNPYDPVQNDVRVDFIGPKGPAIERIAYFDGHGAWKAILVTPIAGKYQATLVRNGKKALEPAAEGVLDVERPLPFGFLRPDPEYRNRFRRDTGEPYYPVGFDLGWQNGDLIPMKDELGKMGKNGVNWTRIWASQWDGKNPWWPQNDPHAIAGQLWPPALDTWQGLEEACEADGVNFQMTLFNHGSFSSFTDPNWPENPWNSKNGGFLKDAGDFFTDAEAKRRTKMWLRYAVARYAASPNLMAWELFNEVQWVDAVHENRWGDIVGWHQEMADYLRSLDPYHHMVTTSSQMDQPGLLEPLDYVQPHTYPSNVLAAINGADMPKDKPGFFGEFGPGDAGRTDLREVIRDGIYGAMLANHAGTAMFWYWDLVEKQNLYGEFATAAKVLSLSDLASHPTARKFVSRVTTPGAADLSFAPGGGFEKAARTHLALPDDLNPKALAQVPSFLQGNIHRDMFPEPLTFSFTTPKAGTLKLAIGTVAKSGANLHVKVNGREALYKEFPPQDADHPGTAITCPFPAGAVTISLFNDGPDWLTVQNVALSNAGAQATALAMGETDWMLLRLTQAIGVTGPVTATVVGFGLADGDYDVTTVDLVTGDSSVARRHIRDFQLRDFPLMSADQMLIFKHA